jgi:hypothetical protein
VIGHRANQFEDQRVEGRLDVPTIFAAAASWLIPFGEIGLTFPSEPTRQPCEKWGCGTLPYMSKKLKELLERVATWPDAAQEEAQASLEAIEQDLSSNPKRVPPPSASSPAMPRYNSWKKLLSRSGSALPVATRNVMEDGTSRHP